MASNVAWGIDIGNRALKAIKLVREGDQLRVDDFEVIEHESVLSNAGDNRESLIQAALSNFVQRHPIKGAQVAVGVSGQSSFARFIKLPPVEPKKIPEIVRFEAIQQIPFPLDDVEWSYQLFQPPDSPDVEVGIFAMRKELVNQHITYFTDSDLNVQVVQMNPLAVYNSMYHDGKVHGTTMIVDLGAENTDLIICDEDSIWMRSIPIGGNNFTETLAKAFKLNFQKAEELKRNAATSKYARQIFQAMRPIFADLVAEVQRSIGFYASVHRDSRIGKIYAIGGTFKLPGLQKYLQQNLQLDVERLDSLGAGAPSDPKLAATFNDNILSMVSAYGLAAQALGGGKVNSNLLPTHIRRERMWQDKTKWFGLAAALFVVGTGIGYFSWFAGNMAWDGASASRQDIQSISSTATQLDTDWTAIESAGSADRQRITNINSLTEYRDFWPSLLADIDAAVPKVQGDAATLKKTPRNQRKHMVLDSIETRYTPDLSPIVNDPDFKRFAAPGALPASVDPNAGAGGETAGLSPEEMAAMGMAAPAPVAAAATPAAPTAAGRGFLIVLTGVTTYSAGSGAPQFINDSLIKSLQKIANDRSRGSRQYYVSKVELASAKLLSQDAQRMSTMKGIYDAAVRALTTGQTTGGLAGYAPAAGGNGQEGLSPEEMAAMNGGLEAPGSVPATGAPGTLIEDQAYRDRVTGEDVRNDWEFTVIATVSVDPPPPPEVTTEVAAPADAAAAAAPQ